MYENKTEDIIRQSMLASVTSPVTRTEGTYIWDALSPAANEMAKLYMALDSILKVGFASTSYGEYLDMRASEFGVTRKQGNKATGYVTLTGANGINIPAGFKVMTEAGLEYALTQEVFIWGPVQAAIEAVAIGEEYNVPAGYINAPVASLIGLDSVINASALSGGAGIEEDAALLSRLLIKSRTPAASGNQSDYQTWALEVPGVGDARVIPVWDGPGTVKVVLIDENKLPINSAIAETVASHIETVRPVGVVVTVSPALALPTNVAVRITRDGTRSLEAITQDIEAVVAQYLEDIAFKTSYVSAAKLGSLIVAVPGIKDYTDLTLGGYLNKNLVVPPDQVAVKGLVTVVE